jgi:RNA polymerase sigma-70 factor (ECF subfamily)
MDNKSDEYYIGEILNGDPGSFSHLVDRYKDLAFSLSLKIMENREDAEDAAQEAFVKAYKSLYLFKRESSFKTWFFRIVYNTAVSKLRSTKNSRKTVRDVEIPDIEVDEAETALGNLKEKDRQRYLQLALKKLDPEERSLITMFYYDSFQVNEISQITELSAPNVKVKLHRSRKKLYTVLKTILKDEASMLIY